MMEKSGAKQGIKGHVTDPVVQIVLKRHTQGQMSILTSAGILLFDCIS